MAKVLSSATGKTNWDLDVLFVSMMLLGTGTFQNHQAADPESRMEDMAKRQGKAVFGNAEKRFLV